MTVKTREYLFPVSITLTLLAISYLLHLQWCDSPMNATHEHWQNRITGHLNRYPFSIRYFTTYGTIALNKITGYPYRESFYILQYFLAFLLGPIFYRYLRELGNNKIWSNIGLIILMSAYPVMAAHFEPVHTWDDIWAYLFLTLTFLSLTGEKFYRGALFFTLACFSREQTMIFYPVYFSAVWLLGTQLERQRKILLMVLPLAIYGPFYMIVYRSEGASRYLNILFNFENAIRIRDTLFSWFVAFGFVWLAALISLVSMIRENKTPLIKLIFWGGIYMGIANTLFTLFCTTARETRIFFPPFVFFIPLSLMALKPAYKYISTNFTTARKITFYLVIAALIVGGVYLAKSIFYKFEYRQCQEYGRIWTGINIGIIAALVLIYTLIPSVSAQNEKPERSDLSSESSNSF